MGSATEPPAADDLKSGELEQDDVYVETVRINYGMKDKNPVDKVNFYNPKDGGAVGPIPGSKVSCLIPHVFEERYVRCYVRRKEKHEAAAKAFKRWATRAAGVDPLSPLTPSRKRPREPAFLEAA